MNTKTMIVLTAVGPFDGRKQMELIENASFTLDEAKKMSDDEFIQIYTLSDFIDACNNQEINLEEYWLSYINITN
jgi:hypothetical protein